MTNIEKYNEVFKRTFRVEEAELEDLKYQSVEAWDSVGQMELVAELEETFGIMFETEDMMDIVSYGTGKEILKKYEIEL